MTDGARFSPSSTSLNMFLKLTKRPVILTILTILRSPGTTLRMLRHEGRLNHLFAELALNFLMKLFLNMLSKVHHAFPDP